MSMAAANEGINAEKENTDNLVTADLDGQSEIELEQGRVWRHGSSTTQTDKQKNNGPVLRTTVKPVKRFRPDSRTDKSNPSPSRKRRNKCSRDGSSQCGKNNPEESASSNFDATARVKISINSTSAIYSPNGKSESEHNEQAVEGTPYSVSILCPICSSLPKFTIDKEKKTHVQDAAAIPVKKKRVWEQWSVDDKNYFFEAVAMYGKDFESIRTAIAQKHRKKGEVCVAKTKDQVRHLYYRTWTMISKLIDADAYPVNINKAFQELYAVINYGEIRKRLGGNLKKKGIEKLNELIRDGTTSMRVKGKNFRIKTPSCKALKKMNPEYHGKEGINDLPLISDTRRMKIPLQVTVELYPLTMAAWNQVHSIAHNPRIRIKLPVQCQLSSIFTFLEKKWKPLSTKLIRVGDQSQSKSAPISKVVKPPKPSAWDQTFVIQTPPDATVNTRIMVFQVTNNKTHCVVSYALRKSSLCREKVLDCTKNGATNDAKTETMTSIGPQKSEDMENHQQALANGELSESEVVDSCASSEEDYDYDSANEALAKDDAEDQTMKKVAPSDVQDDFPVETLITSFSLNEKEGVVTSASLSLENPEYVDITNDVNSPSKCTLSNDHVDNTALDDEMKEINYSCGKENDSCSPECSTDIKMVEDDTNAVESEKNADVHEDEGKDMEMVANGSLISTNECKKNSDVKLKDSSSTVKQSLLNSDCSSCHTDSSNDHCDFIELSKGSEVCKILSNNEPSNCLDADDDSNSIKDDSLLSKTEKISARKTTEKLCPKEKPKKLMLSAKLFGKANEKKKYRTKKSKIVKTIQNWTAKDCRKTTLAEIYMMLGKPSVFRLCYDWIKTSTDTNSNEYLTNSEDDNNFASCAKLSLCSGLMALIQAAQLTQQLREKNTNEQTSKEQVSSPKSSSQKSPKTKQVSIQCDLLKHNSKVDDKSSHRGSCGTNSTSSSVTLSSNPHGRGISKIIPVDSVLVDAMPTGFAIPTIPVNRNRRIMANPAKPVQGTTVSAETMNWLLQRERSRNNRQVRKPILVERALQPKISPSVYRQMKTFSIVTCGPNKVGFLPSKPVLSSRRLLAKPSSSQEVQAGTSGTIIASESNKSEMSTTLNIEDLLQLDADVMEKSNKDKQSVVLDPANLLAQAAKEAGVAPPTPGKENTAEDQLPCESSTNPEVFTSQVINSSSESTGYNPEESNILNAASSSKDLQALDILKDAFGEKPPMLHSASLTFSSEPSSSNTPLTQTSKMISSPTPTSSIDSFLDLSWSSHGILPGTFPVISDSFVDKLVHGDSDIVLSSLNNTEDQSKNNNKEVGKNVPDKILASKPLSLSTEAFELHLSSSKSIDLPIHPWTINTNSRESIGLSGLLNTPQKVLCDSECDDSLDGMLMKNRTPPSHKNLDMNGSTTELSISSSNDSKKFTEFKSRHISQDQNSTSNFLAETDPEVDIQLQCMLNENSVDYISKFQDLVRQTTEYEELSVINADENARDGHLSPNLCNIADLTKEFKDNG